MAKIDIKKKSTAGLLAAAMFMMLAVPGIAVKAQPTGDIGSKSQQAAQVAQEINALDQELGVATEAFNRVKSELDDITEKVDKTRQRLFEIKQSLKERRKVLSRRAAAMYMNGKTSMLEVLLRTKDFSDFMERADYVARIAENDASLIERIKSSRDTVAEVERQLSEQQRQQKGLYEQAAAKTSEIQLKLNDRQNLLNGINQEIQQMLEQQRQQSAAQSAQLEREAQSHLSDVPGSETTSGLAKTAMRYLGVPYHWAGAGPGVCPTGEHRICFDCSGLTMYVYKQYGIELPHNAAMQFNRGVKIPLPQAKAGDLVFFGMPPHHVGMYLGNDLFIEAPRTGDVVKVSKLSNRGDFTGTCRFAKGSGD